MFQPPGYFVEVGAVDGDFMTQTLALERNLSWTGLLIEPDPRSFLELQKAKRNAWLSNTCINFNFPAPVSGHSLITVLVEKQLCPSYGQLTTTNL